MAKQEIKKPVIRTPYTNKFYPRKLEPENNVGKTVPDMSLTIRQILNKHGVGGIFSNGKTPIYLGDVELPNIEMMELADIKVLEEQVMERIAIRRKEELEAKEAEIKRRKEAEVDRLAQQKMEEYLTRKRFVDKGTTPTPNPND